MTSPTLDPTPSAAVAGELRRALNGEVLVAGDDRYDDARRAWNAMVDRRPAIIARCHSADDVAAAIRYGRKHDVEIGVRCGGHSVTGLSIPDGGLMIDLSPMKAVEVDVEGRLAVVGGGALLGDLDRASQAEGLATTAGNVSHTGVGGLTLGGGMGWLARRLGLACDNVAAYEVVTADGAQLTASASENADLFWGLRGGGGNFGVVTSFTFRLHPVDGRALGADFFVAAEHGAAAIRAWRGWALQAPREATPTAWAGSMTEAPFLPPELHGVPLANIGFVWVGDPEDGQRQVDELRSVVGVPIAAELLDEMSYLDLQTGGDESMRHGMRRYWKSHYLAELSDGAIDAFLDRGGAAATGGFQPNGFIQAYGGAIADVAYGDSAFSHRDTAFEFVSIGSWEDPAEDAARMDANRRYAAAVEPFASGVYVNGLADEGGSGVARAYRAETLARLIQLKDRYDPNNLFHLNHNIPPSGGR